jgi:hypothetical protein
MIFSASQIWCHVVAWVVSWRSCSFPRENQVDARLRSRCYDIFLSAKK